MAEKLEAFCNGDESAASLAAWARALWDSDGTQAGPLRTNTFAAGVLGALYNSVDAAGLGWFEFVRFASPGTGRSFLIGNALSRYGGEEPYQPTISTESAGEPLECLVDLVETLCIDASDLTWTADEFANLPLPEWIVIRQTTTAFVPPSVSSAVGAKP